jgi:hypothetical protein
MTGQLQKTLERTSQRVVWDAPSAAATGYFRIVEPAPAAAEGASQA